METIKLLIRLSIFGSIIVAAGILILLLVTAHPGVLIAVAVIGIGWLITEILAWTNS